LLPAHEFKTLDLISLQVMDAIGAALEPADDHGDTVRSSIGFTGLPLLSDDAGLVFGGRSSDKPA
jgi:hypothetical protein